MNILIPDHIFFEHRRAMENCRLEVEFLPLTVVREEPVISKIIRKSGRFFLPYALSENIMCEQRKNFRYSFFVNGKRISENFPKAEALLVSWEYDAQILEQLFKRLPKLRWVHSWKTGVDHIPIERLKEQEIVLTNSRGVHSKRIAEFCLACILTESKNILKHITATRQRKWIILPSRECHELSVLVVGTGHIGQLVAEKCRALGMRVFGCNQSPCRKDLFEEYFPLSALDQAVGKADVIVITLPLTKETLGIFNEKVFSNIRQNTIFINVGRYKIMKKEALIKAVKSEIFQALYIDVPFKDIHHPRHPLYRYPKVILTHYCAHSSLKSSDEVFDLFLKNVRYYLEQKSLINEITL